MRTGFLQCWNNRVRRIGACTLAWLCALCLFPARACAADLAALVPLLPDRPGWSAGDPRLESAGLFGFGARYVRRAYSSGDTTVEMVVAIGKATRLIFDRLDRELDAKQAKKTYRRSTLNGAQVTRVDSADKSGIFVRLADVACLIVTGPPGSAETLEQMAVSLDWAAIVAASEST